MGWESWNDGGALLAQIAAASQTSAGDKAAFTPVLTAATFSAGQVLFDFQALPNVVTAAGRISLLQDLLVADQADTGATLTFLIANASASLGTAGAAPTITDADCLKISAIINIAVADWVDLGGARVANIGNIGKMLKPASGTSAYIACLITTGGTGGTFAVGSLQLLPGIVQG